MSIYLVCYSSGDIWTRVVISGSARASRREHPLVSLWSLSLISHAARIIHFTLKQSSSICVFLRWLKGQKAKPWAAVDV